jgi:hypothetical protein
MFEVDVAARGHALRYLGRRHPDADTFPMTSEASLWDRKRHTCSTCECGSPTDRAGTSQCRCRSEESGSITRELGRSCQYLLTISQSHTSNRRTHVCFYTRITTCPGIDYSIPFAIWPVTSISKTKRCLTFVIINDIGEQLCTYQKSKFHPSIFTFVTTMSYRKYYVGCFHYLRNPLLPLYVNNTCVVGSRFVVAQYGTSLKCIDSRLT